MSRVSRSIRRSARAIASTSAVVGFRPSAAALTVATAFAMHGMPAWGQPSGAQVIHGQAGFSSNGNHLTITTQNGAGTRHSAINWQSFSVPAGSITQFNQPSATSTSINRVIGANPSAIFGTLSSNGRLVLVNPAGIAVGKGAVVDTAAFTASTLAMSQADAIAGRLLFSGGASALQVDGRIVARSGDVVLIAPQLQAGAEAVIQSQGATVLAAGQKVEITGRGLEGIRMEVQAPENEAVNLGKLQGDAVGIFAGTLRHSGLVQAHAASVEGGKVVLKAQGDNVVNGAVTARAGEKGGSIDVLGQRVALQAGAAIDASAAQGGGQVRVGGDYQGRNADVPNAQFTSVAAGATINADATAQGPGGRVIVWADDTTLFAGQISARGGAQGGDGGFAEVSGKRHLEFTGRADLRAPQGAVGTLLLDPEDVVIGEVGDLSATMTDAVLNAQLAFSNVQVTTSGGGSSAPLGGQIHLLEGATVAWDRGTDLSLLADNGIRLDGRLSSISASVGAATGGLHLRTYNGTISQGANSSIVMSALLAQADNGSVVLDQANNNVGTIAGYAYGAGNIFNYRNNNALTIGSVGIGGYGSATGIDNYNGAGALADIRVVVDAGNLTLNNAGLLRGGSITLKAPVDVQVEGTYLEATSGLLHLDAGNDVAAGLTSYVQLSGRGGAGKGVKIDAGRDFSSGEYQLSVYTDQSPITVTAGGSITGLASFNTEGGLAGTVQLTAATGSLTFNQVRSNGSYSGNAGGNVTLHAAGNIDGGSISARGAYNVGAAGGNASVTSTGGDIRLGSIDLSGGYGSGSATAGGAGGALTVTALGTASTAGHVDLIGHIESSGGGVDSGQGGAGGAMVVHAHKGISTSSIALRGGQVGYGSSGDGGAGGSVSIASVGGSISMSGVQTQGGTAWQGTGGGGGDVKIQALGADAIVTLSGNVSAAGGDGYEASGGAAGKVLVEADGDIRLGAITATGGSAAGSGPAAGGQGGDVQVTSVSGGIAFGSKDEWGNVTVYAGVDASGGFGASQAAGGAGGAITLSALGTGPGLTDVMVTGDLNASGGGSQSAPAGHAGNLLVRANRHIDLYTAQAIGGSGWSDTGRGGNISMLSGGGDVTLWQINAHGVVGGNVKLASGGGDIVLYAIDAGGRYGNASSLAGSGGGITLEAFSGTATGGNITVHGNLVAQGDTSPTGGGAGGAVTVQAQRDINIAGIYVQGGSASLGSGGGAGGTVTVHSVDGNVMLSTVDARGGTGMSLAAGGAGGSITLTTAGTAAGTGGVYGAGTIRVDGGQAEQGDAGAAGGISVAAQGAVDLVDLQASGGTNWSGNGGLGGSVGVGSAAGNITVGNASAVGSTGGDITITATQGNLTLGSAQVNGRDGGSLAAGGDGGSITLQAPGTAAGGGMVTVTGKLDAAGGAQGEVGGGRGGNIVVAAHQGVLVGEMDVRGGTPWWWSGSAYGGDGGMVDVQSVTSSIVTGGIDASGGGALGTGAGGHGGVVTLNAVAGAIAVGGHVGLRGGASPDGQGGDGGTVLIEATGSIALGQIDVTGGGAGGNSGNIAGRGGAVEVTSTGGSISLGAYDGETVTRDGGVTADGGFGNSLAAGGAGGSILLSAYGTGAGSNGILVTNYLAAEGGGAASAPAGAGGNLALSAAGGIHVFSGAYARGGADSGAGGDGGSIVMATSSGDIVTSVIHATGRDGGVVDLSTDDGIVSVSSIEAFARATADAPVGGDGGTVRLQALGSTGDVHAGSVYVQGAGVGTGASGAGGSVTVTAQRDVNVGYVYADGGSRVFSSLGSASGGSGGQVLLHSLAGNVTTSEIHVSAGHGSGTQAAGTGGTIELAANGAAAGTGIVTVDYYLRSDGAGAEDGAAGSAGTITLSARNGVTVGNISGVGGADWISAGGFGGVVTLDSAAGNISLGTATLTGGIGGNFTATTTQGNISAVDINVSGHFGYDTAGGTAGNIHLAAGGSATTGGNVSVSGTLRADGGPSIEASAGNGGQIRVEAYRNIQLQSVLASGGTSSLSQGGAGGQLLLSALTGDISAWTLQANGHTGGQIAAVAAGGNITLDSAVASGGNGSALADGLGGTIELRATGTAAGVGNVTVNGYLEARGGGAIDAAAGFGGAVIVAADKQIQLAWVDVQGGSSFGSVSGGPGAGGAGGFVDLRSHAGNIVMPGSIVAGGGQGAPGASGGFVQVTALQGSVAINDISVAGGSGNTAAAAGGQGGGVDIRARDDINLGGPFAGYFVILADGGNAGETGIGGNGGFISVTSAAGSVQVTDIVDAFGISAIGGEGASGGSGGAVILQAAGNIKVPYVETWGASAYGSEGGGAGGNGGVIDLKFGGTLDTYGLYAYGGFGQDGQAATPSGGAGGAGGGVRIERTTGDLAVPFFDIQASAGSGGHAGAESTGTGGAGGAGGSVMLVAAAGSISLEDAWLYSAAGFGGLNGDGLTTAANGAVGNINVRAAGSVNIANVNLDLGSSNFTAEAGGTIELASTIRTGGGAVTLHAGMPTLSATPGDLNLRAAIDTRGGEGMPSGAISLAATGTVLLAVPDTPPEEPGGDFAFSAFSITPPPVFSGGLTTITGATVVIDAVTNLVTTGELQISADSLALDGTVNSGAARTVIRTFTNSTPIRLGGTDEAGKLHLSQDELNRVTASTLVIGSGDATGGLLVDGPITLSPAAVPALSLINAGAIGQSAGAPLTVGALNADGGTVTLDNVFIGTLSGRGSAGAFTVVNQAPGTLTVGTVDGIAGIAGAGTVEVRHEGLLQLSQLVTSTAGGDAVVLSADNLLVDGAGAIATSAGRWLTYLDGALAANTFGSLSSGNFALWNRTHAGSPPGSVTETGNRFLFAHAPTVTIDAAASTKVYDGSSTFTGLTFASTGLVDASLHGSAFLQDVFTGALSTTATKNVGSYRVTQGTLGVAGYASVFNDNAASITPASLSVAGLAALAKVYDGTTAATLGGAVTFGGLVAGDDVVFGSGTGTFADKNAGPGKLVTVDSIGLAGADFGNYTVTLPASVLGDITQRTLNATAAGVNKVYDRTTTASVVFGDDRVAGDVLTVGGSASFGDKNAGTGKLVTAGGLSLSGLDAANYVLGAPTVTTIADITPRTLVAGAVGQNKVYDGNTSAVVTFTDDRLAGDVFSVTGSAAFSDKNAGAGKLVTANITMLTGLDAGNYALASPTATTTADIAARLLNVNAIGQNKVYDQTTTATVTYTDDRVAGDGITIAGAASFADKNAGTGKPVTVSGVALGGLDGGNYTLAGTTLGATADITPRTISVLANAQNRVYDRTTNAAVTFTDDRLAGDALTVGGSGSFADRNVGTAKLVTVNGIALSGADAGNYALAGTSAMATADITPRMLGVTALGQNKVYDGNTSALVNFSDDRLAGDVFTVSGAANFSDKNAGAGKLVTATALGLAGADAGNYVLSAPSVGTIADITQRTLNASAIGQNKVYDRTTAATVVFGDDRVAGDVLTLGGSASFADKNAGTGKSVTAAGLTLSGLDAANYLLASPAVSTTADITPRTLVVGAIGQNKVYDGNTSALVTFSDDRLAGDVFSVSGAANFSDKNAGVGKLVTASALGITGADAGNYALSAPTVGTTADIAQRTLNTSAAGVNKVYDRTTTASVVFGDDRVTGDVLSVVGSASFADKNAGVGKAVTVSGVALAGTDAGNYVLGGSTLATAADITPRTLSVSALAQAKVYDGGTGATVTFSDDRLAGDLLVIGGSATFADKNVGTAKLVTASGLGVTGTDAANYALAAPSALTAADITARMLNVTAAGVNKVYDGTTAATVSYGDDRVGGDILTVGGSASFADRHVGTAKPVTVTGVALAGADAGNYMLSGAALSTAADITRRVLSVSASAQNKVYDGTTAATVTLIDNRIAGDELAISGSGAFADKYAGNGKAVTVSGVALTGGADAGNYLLAPGDATTSANIDPRTLLLTAQNRVYDGTRNATFTDDRLAGDQLTVTGTAQFADKNAGTGKPVALSGMLIDLASGPDARNYVLVGANAGTTVPVDLSSTATIDRRLLQVAARDKVYDGTRDAQFKDDRIAGDELALAGTAQFADKNAGTGKPVTISGLAIASGADAGNYVLAMPSDVVANITRKVLVVSAKHKPYDGTVDAILGDDRIPGDVLTLSGIARFEDKNAGTGKEVQVTGVAITSGADAGNYILPETVPAQQRADITPAELVIGARNLTKDQGTLLTFTGSEFETTGLVGDEKVASVSLTSTGAAAEAATGAYAIKPSNAVPGTGFLAGNYRIVYLDGALAVSAAAAAAAEPVKQVTTQVVTFATLFVEEAKAQAAEEKAEQKKKDPEKGKDDISVTDTQCTP